MKFLIGVLMMSFSLMAGFKAIDANELLKMQKQGVVVIDIRTPAEWKERGVIKGAKTMMFFTPTGNADVGNFMFELGHLIKDKKEPFIIYCAHANRTKELGRWLNSLGFKNVYELDGGIEYGWIDKGFKTVPYNKVSAFLALTR